MSQRRALSPASLFDQEVVRIIAVKLGVQENTLKSTWRSAAREGSTDTGVLRGSCEITTSVRSALATSAQKGFKLVVELQDGQLAETVAIVHEYRAGGALHGRITVCVSSQVGCKMGCTFCATGTMGFRANLTAGEICEQVWHVERRAPDFGVYWRVTNVVFMGMGEPLNNYAAVVGALRTCLLYTSPSPRDS